MKLGRLTLFERKVIGDGPVPLLVRHIVFRLPSLGVYIHKLCRSDHDRALHDHPWPFVSVILRTGYFEVHDQTIDGKQVTIDHQPGALLLRPAEWRHRVIIKDGKPAWTLVIVGRRLRKWGFFTPTGWCWWRKYNYATAICEDEILWEDGSD